MPSTTERPRLLRKHETSLLETWLAEQKSVHGAGALISDFELRAQSSAFIQLLQQAVTSGPIDDFDSPGFRDLRRLLDGITAVRVQVRLSPTDTAIFVFSFKQALFEQIRESVPNPKTQMDELWAATLLLDRLGLFVTEACQRARETVIVRQQQEMLELSTPGGEALGRCACPADHRSARQLAHADDHRVATGADRRDRLRACDHRHHRRAHGGYGLGHGTCAHEAAGVAVELFLHWMRSQPPGKTISTADLVTHLHGPMHATRGAAVALVRAEPERRVVTFCGVGNISGSLIAPNGETRVMISHDGTLGHEVERVQEFNDVWQRDSPMVLHTDGVHTSWKLEKTPGLARQASATIACAIYRDAWRGRDDATVLVARLA